MKTGKKNKRIKKVIISVVILLLITIGYCFAACMPFHGVEKECDVSRGGQKLKISGRDIWYKIYNENAKGTPVYVIAGGTGLSSDYLESGLMFLSDTHPVVFYDGRCAGRSEYTSDLSDCTFKNYAKDLESLRKYLTPEKDIIIAAHSYGGATALQYACDYSDNMESMILISSVGAKTSLFFSDAYFHTGLPPLDQEKANKWFIDNIEYTFGAKSDKSDIPALFKNSSFNYALMMRNNALERYDLTEELGRSDVPVLILVGGDSETPITNIEIAEELHGILKNSRLHQFEDCGHFCFAEEPDLFKDTVMNFLIN